MRGYATFLKLVAVAGLVGLAAAGATWFALGPVEEQGSYVECSYAGTPDIAPQTIRLDGTACPRLLMYGPVSLVGGPVATTPYWLDDPTRDPTTIRNAAIAFAVTYLVLILIVVPARLLRRRDPP